MVEGTVKARSQAQGFTIKRPRLTTLLDNSGARFLLLVAPAGYGKTTLAREWTEGREGVIWYTGGPAMADVAALAAGVAEALTARDEVAERVRILAARGQPAQGLARAVAAAVPKNTGLLVIDDYHYAAESPDADAFMSELVSLTQFRLLLTSRVRPAWITPRMAVYGEATILEMGDLAFTNEEAEQVLASEGQAAPAAIVSQARGWPAVIGLAAMRGGTSGPDAGLQAEDLYDYFAEDLFRSASPELRNRCSCSRSAATQASRWRGNCSARSTTGSWRRRRSVDSSDAVRAGSVAIHPLLRGFLLSKLRESGEPEADTAVRRVVTHLAASHLWDTCLAALTAFPSEDLIASTLSDALDGLLSSGRVATLQQWLELARSHNLTDPIFLLAEAEVALRARTDTRRTGSWRAKRETSKDADLAARAHLTAARAAHLLQDGHGVIANAERAQALATRPEIRFEALWLEFLSAAELQGEDADSLLERLEEFEDAGPDRALRMATGRGLITCEHGRPRDAAKTLDLSAPLLAHARDPLARTGFLNISAQLHCMLARYESAVNLAHELLTEARLSGLEFAGDYALAVRARRFGRDEKTPGRPTDARRAATSRSIRLRGRRRSSNSTRRTTPHRAGRHRPRNRHLANESIGRCTACSQGRIRCVSGLGHGRDWAPRIR